MANAKYWLLGKHLTAINVYGGTRNSTTGVITYGSALNLAGQVDFIRANVQNLLDMIVSVDADRAHYEPTIIDSGLSIGEILKVDGNILDSASFTFTYMKVVFTRGLRTFSFEGVVDTYNDGVTALGKNVNMISLRQISLTSTGGLTIA